MNGIETGGPAFPVNELNQETGDICAQHLGISARDYFASEAMKSLIVTTQDNMKITIDMVASEAYMYADAMLIARSKK